MFFKKEVYTVNIEDVQKYISEHYRYTARTHPKKEMLEPHNMSVPQKRTTPVRPKPAPPPEDGPVIRYSSRNTDIKYSNREPPEDYYDRKQLYSMINAAYRNQAASDKSFKKHTEMTFVGKLLDYLSIKNLSDSKVYKRAQIDRRLYSKIVCDNDYKPSKDTCIALCVGLQLNLEKTIDMLRRAGYTFSHSSKRDIIIEYCFENSIWDMNTINEILYKFSEKLLGR